MTEQEIWNHYNSLLLSPDVERIRKLLVRYELFKMSLDVPGDIVECGVFKGVGLMYWLKLLRIFAPAAHKRVIGIDTFSSFPGSLLPYEERAAQAYLGEAGSEGVEASAILEMVRATGFERQVELVMGDVQETAKQYVADNPGFRISLIHLDLDTYAGTKAALENLYPLVSRGGVIVLDEYGVRGWGESDAVEEFFSGVDVDIRSVPFSHKPTAYIIKGNDRRMFLLSSP